MTGAPSDSHGGGLFRTASAGNISRRFKALRRKAAGALSRPASILPPKKPPASPKRDQVAELLSQGLEFDAIAERAGLTLKAVRKHFEAIRKQLGPQAK